MKRIDMVRRGAQQLIEAENAVENALVKVMALGSNLGEMRMSSRLSMIVGQDAIGALVKSITMLSNARAAMIEAHGHLDGVKTQLGCQAVMVGNTNKPDDNGIVPESLREDLRLVPSEKSAA